MAMEFFYLIAATAVGCLWWVCFTVVFAGESIDPTRLISMLTIRRQKVVDEAQMQIKQILIIKHKTAEFTAKRWLIGSNCSRRFLLMTLQRWWWCWFGHFRVSGLSCCTHDLCDTFRLRLRFNHFRLFGWQWMSKEMNCELIETEQNLIAFGKWTLNWFTIHFYEIKFEGLEIGKARQTA